MLMTLAPSMSLLPRGASMTVHDFQAKTIGGEVTWNFNKFLVDPTRRVVAHLDSAVEPTSAEMKKRIEAILPRT
jgi:glutathione peroxidase-family protein